MTLVAVGSHIDQCTFMVERTTVLLKDGTQYASFKNLLIGIGESQLQNGRMYQSQYCARCGTRFSQKWSITSNDEDGTSSEILSHKMWYLQ